MGVLSKSVIHALVLVLMCRVALAQRCLPAEGYAPSEQYPDHTSLKLIKVNVHFMLKDTLPGAPGNFMEVDDRDNDIYYNGYKFAGHMIEFANRDLSFNPQMNLPPGNTTPALPIKYRYVLTGTYFHRDDDAYYFDNKNGYRLLKKYGVNVGSEINVFMQEAKNPEDPVRGYAVMRGHRYVVASQAFAQWRDGKDAWSMVGLLNHEIGHNLGLRHTIFDGAGRCSSTAKDVCEDTPTRPEILEAGLKDPCCWGARWSKDCSNNMMDYNDYQRALTPCQLNIMHRTLFEMKDYLANDFCANQGDTLIIPSGDTVSWACPKRLMGSVRLKSGSVLKLSCDLFLPLNASIMVEQGATLVLDGARLSTECEGNWKGVELASPSFLGILGKRGRLEQENAQIEKAQRATSRRRL